MAANYDTDEEEIELYFSHQPELQTLYSKEQTSQTCDSKSKFGDMLSSRLPGADFQRSQGTTTHFPHSGTRSKPEMFRPKHEKMTPLKYETVIDLAALSETDLSPNYECSRNKGSSWFTSSQTRKPNEARKQSKKMALESIHADQSHIGVSDTGLGLKDTFNANLSPADQETNMKKWGRKILPEKRLTGLQTHSLVTPSAGRCKAGAAQTKKTVHLLSKSAGTSGKHYPQALTIRQQIIDSQPEPIARGDNWYAATEETFGTETCQLFSKTTLGDDKLERIPERTMARDKCANPPERTMCYNKREVLPDFATIEDEFDSISRRSKSRDNCHKFQDNTRLQETVNNTEKTEDDKVNLGNTRSPSLTISVIAPHIRNSLSMNNSNIPVANQKHNNNSTNALSYMSKDVHDFDNQPNMNANNVADAVGGDIQPDNPDSEDGVRAKRKKRADNTTTDNTTTDNDTTDNDTTDNTTTDKTTTDNDTTDNTESSALERSDSSEDLDSSAISKKGKSSSPDTTETEVDNTSSSSSLQDEDSPQDKDSKGSKDQKGSSSSSGSSDTKKGSSSSSASSDTKKKKKKFKKRKGFVVSLLKSSPEDKILLKMVIWLPVGIAISVILYFMIIRKMNMTEEYKSIAGTGLGIVLSFTFSFNVQMRCVMTLVVPSFVGKAGRSYFAAFAIVYLINGPISNIMENCKDVVRSMTCNSALTANHTRAKWALRLHPVEHALGDLMKDNFLVVKASKTVKKAFKPLRKEVDANMAENEQMKKDINKVEKSSGSKTSSVDAIEKKYKTKEEKVEAGKQVEKEWAKKMDLRCKGTFSNGVQKCKDKMGDLWDQCLDALWILGYLLCWPMKITIFCEIIKLIPGALGMDCEAAVEVSPGFGDTYLAAKGVMDDMDKGTNVNMQYKIVGSADSNYAPVEEMRQSTMHAIKAKTELIGVSLNIITYLLTFTFLIIFYGAYKYNRRYLTDLQWDNKYITSYFRHIDARRKNKGKPTLLPLKKIEKKTYYDPHEIKLGAEEKKQFVKGTTQLIMRVITSGIIIYMDSMFYQVLDIIRRNSRIEYHQTGEHIIDIRVYGRGFMSAIVRSFLERFNSKQKLDSLTSNFDCLPKALKTDTFIIAAIFGTYFLVWCFMYFQAFGLRLRRSISSFYYRKREKKRILYLYNEMYRQRVGFLKHMRAQVRKQLKNREFQKKVGLLYALKREHPVLCKCLNVFQSTKDTCIICGDVEDKTFHNCETEGCGVSYCHECWLDSKKKCYSCGQKSDTEEDDSTDGGTVVDSDTSNEDTE